MFLHYATLFNEICLRRWKWRGRSETEPAKTYLHGSLRWASTNGDNSIGKITQKSYEKSHLTEPGKGYGEKRPLHGSRLPRRG